VYDSVRTENTELNIFSDIRWRKSARSHKEEKRHSFMAGLFDNWRVDIRSCFILPWAFWNET